MAVFTPVTRQDIEKWLVGLECGQLVSHQGISSGIENTNYFVTTSTGKYVLTIFEKLDEQDLPFYLGLMEHLANKGLPVPCPVPSEKGTLFGVLKNKPATLVNCLAGQSTDKPNAAQCREIGNFSAQAHNAVKGFAGKIPNPRGLSWIESACTQLQNHLPDEELALLKDEIAHQQKIAGSALYAQLKRGAVHADLFRDNALMQGDALGGVIDFYFAGVDTFLFDLAVTANDWCSDHVTGHLQPHLLDALLSGYREVNDFTEAELQLWPELLRAAALRFWTSRLFDYFMPRQAEVLNTKDPKHFERVLRSRREKPVVLLN